MVPAVETPDRAPSPPAVPVRRIALIGNPNTGKTTLFNALCGARAKTSNFPGTTTAMRTGHAEASGHGTLDVLDLPGVYDLEIDAPESRIAASLLDGARGPAPDAVVVIVDACNLPRNLVLVGQLLARRVRMVVALNMVDLAERRGLAIDVAALAARLGVPVVPMVARSGRGLDDLRQALGRMHLTDPSGGQTAAATVSRWADDIAAAVSTDSGSAQAHDRFTERLDGVLTHPVFGLAAFIAIMGTLFWILFALATVPMDLIEATFAELGTLVERLLPEGPVRDLVAQGIVGGIAGTVVFLPQICLLFFLITLLEDTGYLARAAFVMDRWLSRFGLPGHAFVPLLTAHACALPGIMSTRLIPDMRDRLTTILVAPFMSCSARLPVYVLLTTLLFADRPGLAGLAFAGCYLLGGLAALFTAKLFGSTILKGRAKPMILELPSYKTPSLRNALLTARDQGLSFLSTAGTVIVAICIVMWWLSAYPKVEPPPEAARLRAAAEAPALPNEEAAALLAEADALEVKSAQAGSFAGRIGHTLAPAFEPLGFDWQLTVGVLTSFLAREVFVSTMSVLAAGQAADDVDDGVVAKIRGMTRDDGRPVFTPATAASALVFFVLAMQCLPTLTVTRKETGGLKYAALQLGYMSGLAYAVAFVLYQSLRAAGVA
ncbi:ferrous iron transporter B [Luteitalea sp.]|uniref:ferrous iron transporter B n=1 Tax=Luteitalea sp. TaxID=2004800 RepID=UPI0025B9151A|nr:ferrous iron transporter B [Luteitalea sp.]